MSERETYPPGVPCWVTNLQHDVPEAEKFYAELFGWEMESGPADQTPYALGRLRGLDAAGIGTLPEAHMSPAWVVEIRTIPLARRSAPGRAATVKAPRSSTSPVLGR